jgi:hypothetical protein
MRSKFIETPTQLNGFIGCDIRWVVCSGQMFSGFCFRRSDGPVCFSNLLSDEAQEKTVHSSQGRQDLIHSTPNLRFKFVTNNTGGWCVA